MWYNQMLSIETDMGKKFKKYALITGIIFVLLGTMALIFPFFMALMSAAFIAWFMIFAGVVAGYYTMISNSREWVGWLKSFILVGTGLFMLFNPIGGVQIVGLLLVIYLLLDGFTNFTLSSLSGSNERWLWIFNGVISIALAVIFLSLWGSIAEESWLIGIYVGISLLVDGVVLIVSSRRMHTE